ncbi:MAG: IgGFc-binding protein [Myxococcota bacterium]
MAFDTPAAPLSVTIATTRVRAESQHVHQGLPESRGVFATGPAARSGAWHGGWPGVCIATWVLVVAACNARTPADTATAAASGSGSSDGATPDDYVCEPDARRCASEDAVETCAPTGLQWVRVPCGANESCQPCPEGDDTCEGARCIGPCQLETERPSSAGCSFIANRQLHLSEDSPDGLVVANLSEQRPATVQLYHVPLGRNEEQAVGEPQVLGPGQSTVFSLDADFLPALGSTFRTGGNYRVGSDAPVVAYQHSPLAADHGNDSSMLLPETALRQDYVVVSFAPHEEQEGGYGEPSYFEIIALEDLTQVQWTPPVDTAGNEINIDSVPAGQTSGTLHLNRFDAVRIAVSTNFEDNADLRDVSGTVIHANKPIWVVGASRCSRVPVRDEPAVGRCDPLQEVLIPLDYWGERYVAAHASRRDDERHWWRIYAGDPGVRVTARGGPGCTEPIFTPDNCPAPNAFDDGACIFDARGSWIQLDVPGECSFVLDSQKTGPFMPVQYLQSSRAAGEPVEGSTTKGDPAMVQMVPVEQFLERYVFATGVGFDEHYVQVIRTIDGPNVRLDGEPVDGFEPVDAQFEVADVLLAAEGPHVIESGGSFGIVQLGYTSGVASSACEAGSVCHASYAYPGGMRSEPINVP